MYWPHMSKNLKKCISKCIICLSHQSLLGRELILQQNIIECPWTKIGVDLCELIGHTLLMVCDYYSNFIEIDNDNKKKKATSQAVSKTLKGMFSRYGIPDIVISGNRPQFYSISSMQFNECAEKWGFKHVISSVPSPH